MRIFLISTVLLLGNSCQAQNNQISQSDIASFFKIDGKEIKNCQRESEELKKQKIDKITINTVQDACIARYEHFNFYRENTLKMLEKIPKEKDFVIINYINDNSMIPHSTKTILNFENNYFGFKHYYNYENDKFIEKNEKFEVNKSDIENIQKIDEYLKTGQSQYVDMKSAGLIGNNAHWHIVARNNGKVRMIELFRIK
ncbi:hypothetical protein ODZ84_18970 [Chryseobacterium fluminis]|uniref:hypothetical protein n=1 Tax=Chryseobacterium fluminis TaxID=2983606 RepID=UPI0022500056|nr:hypothetical protein [Chryseobacterium sp. MMS21-Ot14]UZT97249.1 hypothetical protein ODZ84_18970 [Chryseobacterium sp. MMS21-Ot14]